MVRRAIFPYARINSMKLFGDTMRVAQPIRTSYLRWLALSGILLVGGAALVRWWRSAWAVAQPTADPIPVAPPLEQERSPQPETLAPVTDDSLLAARPVRWMLFALMTAILVWLLLNTSAPYSTVALALVICVVFKQQRLLAVGAIILLTASAFTFRPDDNNIIYLETPVWWLLLGVAALLATIQLGWQSRVAVLPIPADPPQAVANNVRWWHRGLFIVGLLPLIWLIKINSVTLEATLERTDNTSTDVQFALLVAGITLIVAGLGAVRLPRRLSTIQWRAALPVIAIMLVALGIRAWQLHDTTRFVIDEMFFANEIRYQWEWSYIPLIAPYDGVAAEPHLFSYMESLGVGLFGRNFVGLRSASVLIGTLTVGATYLLARAAFDRKTALLAALLLATFPPHIHFSRIGLSEIASGLFGALALAFFMRGLRSNRRFDFAFGGAMLGMTHYFHEGGRFLFTPLVIVWIVGVLLICRPQIDKRNLVIGLMAAFLVALPIYATLVAINKPIAGRMVTNNAGLGLHDWRLMFETGDFQEFIHLHLLPPFLLYVQRADSSLFYGGDTAMILAVVVPAFLVGVVYLLRRLRSPGAILLLLWVVSTSLGNSLLVESGDVPRFVTVFPALMLLAAVGIRYGLPLIWNGKRLALLMAVLVIGLGAVQVNYYFNRHIPLYNDQFRSSWQHPDPQDAILRSTGFPPETTIHIISDPSVDPYVTYGLLNFLVDDLRFYPVTSEDFTTAYLDDLDTDVDQAFYVAPDDSRSITLLYERYGLRPLQYSPYDLPRSQQFALLYIPAAEH
jgi:hypothetical protein